MGQIVQIAAATRALSITLTQGGQPARLILSEMVMKGQGLWEYWSMRRYLLADGRLRSHSREAKVWDNGVGLKGGRNCRRRMGNQDWNDKETRDGDEHSDNRLTGTCLRTQPA